MRNSLRLSASVLALGFAIANSASAQTLTAQSLACTSGGALSTMGALACAGSYTGNNMNQQAAVLNQLATSFNSYVGAGSVWSYLGDPNFTGSGGTGTINFSSVQTGFFVLALKSANGFSLYLWNGGVSGLGSVAFTDIGTAVNGNHQLQDLSHASLYRVSNANNVSASPEPAAMVLMATGLAGVGLITRRRRRTA